MHCVWVEDEPDPFPGLRERAFIETAAIGGDEKIAEPIDLDRVFD